MRSPETKSQLSTCVCACVLPAVQPEHCTDAVPALPLLSSPNEVPAQRACEPEGCGEAESLSSSATVGTKARGKCLADSDADSRLEPLAAVILLPAVL